MDHEHAPADLGPEAITTPRTYRIHPGWRWFFIVTGLGMSTLFAWLAARDAGRGEPLPPGLAIGVPAGILAACLLAAWALGRVRLTVSADAIELVEWGRPRRLRREQLRGVRTVPLQYGQHLLVLEPRTPGARRMKIPSLIRVDAGLAAWLVGLPDLDAEERAEAEKQLLAGPSLGANAMDRQAALAGTRRLAKALNAVAYATAAWTFFYPRPYALAMAATAAVFPLALALALLRPGQVGVEGRRNDPRPVILPALLFPGLALGLRAILDHHLLRYAPALIGAAAGGVLTTAALAACDPALRRRAGALLVMAPLFAFFPFGAGVAANGLLDRSAGTTYRAEVLDRSVSGGKVTTYHLRVGPWGPRSDPEDVEVSRRTYEAAARGGAVWIEVKDGALGMPWYVVRPAA